MYLTTHKFPEVKQLIRSHVIESFRNGVEERQLNITVQDLDEFVGLLGEYLNLFAYEHMDYHESWSNLKTQTNDFKQRFEDWETLKIRMQNVMQDVVINFEKPTVKREES